MKKYMTAVIYGDSKVGKTTLAATAPRPILVLDAEAGGMRFVEGNITAWNPRESAPPEGFDVYQVTVDTLADLRMVYTYLSTQEHSFQSIVFDSVTEIQGRMVREEMTDGVMQQRDWGAIWIKMEDLIWDFRSLVQHPSSTLKALVVIAGVDEINGKTHPMLQGRMRKTLPYKVDLCGYLDLFPNEEGGVTRGLVVVGSKEHIAGERFGGRLGSDIVWFPNLQTMFDSVHPGDENQNQNQTEEGK